MFEFQLKDEHIRSVCKPGCESKTCKFLVMSPSGFTCAKFTGLAFELSGKEMMAEGNNCDALLGIIIENKKDLIGKTVKYEESCPTYVFSGTLKDIFLKNGFVNITIRNSEDEQFTSNLNSDSCVISQNEKELRFHTPGMLAAFCGEITIVL